MDSEAVKANEVQMDKLFISASQICNDFEV